MPCDKQIARAYQVSGHDNLGLKAFFCKVRYRNCGLAEAALEPQANRPFPLKLIDKIEVGEREIIYGQKQREIRIHYKFVGYIG